MASTARQPLTRSKAWTCAGINQLAFPGLGTIISGKKIGYVQAALMLIGFVLSLYFMVSYATSLYTGLSDPNWGPSVLKEALSQKKWYGITGGLLSVIAWTWALLDSVHIILESQKQPPVLGRQ